MYGYHGKILRVDLSKREMKDIELKEEDVKKFIGGAGLAAKLFYPTMTKNLDPLGPENPLAFMTGPLTGAPIPGAGRYTVCAKSPLTGIWGEANSGGLFGVGLKFAGYDGVIITGSSKKPVYFYVHEGGTEIKDASHLWGKGFYETRDTLKEEVGEKRARVAAIGQAGENLVRYAAVMNDHGRAAGRCGMGAVMGSKKLKAVVVHGTKRPEIADPDGLKEKIKMAEIPITDIGNLTFRAFLPKYGTMGYLDMAMYLGDAPTKYFTKSTFPDDKVDGWTLKEKYYVKPVACYGCPVGCGRLTKYDQHGIKEVDGPEYETTVALGPCCMNLDLDSIIHANHLCNDYGMDTISAGVSIAFAMYLYEKGVLTKEKAGMEIKWGDGRTVVNLIEKIAKREGVGDMLAEGVKRMAERLGVTQDEAAHVKGLEIPMHDPRAFFGDAVSYATGPRGACHLKGDYYLVEQGAGVIEAGVSSGDRFESSENKGAMAAKYQNFRELYNSLTLCEFPTLLGTPTNLANLLNAVTGWEFDGKAIMMAGERIFNIKRVINLKLGVTKEDDKLPKIAVEPLSEGSSSGKSPDMETLLRGYYRERGWDPETGKPMKEKLVELELSEITGE